MDLNTIKLVAFLNMLGKFTISLISVSTQRTTEFEANLSHNLYPLTLRSELYVFLFT